QLDESELDSCSPDGARAFEQLLLVFLWIVSALCPNDKLNARRVPAHRNHATVHDQVFAHAIREHHVRAQYSKHLESLGNEDLLQLCWFQSSERPRQAARRTWAAPRSAT